MSEEQTETKLTQAEEELLAQYEKTQSSEKKKPQTDDDTQDEGADVIDEMKEGEVYGL